MVKNERLGPCPFCGKAIWVLYDDEISTAFFRCRNRKCYAVMFFISDGKPVSDECRRYNTRASVLPDGSSIMREAQS